MSTAISPIATAGVPYVGVHAAERRVHQVAPADRVQHPRRRDEVAVEDLQQRQECAKQNQLRDRVRAERAFERDLGAHVARHDLPPRIHVGDDRDDEDVEQKAGEERRVDRRA